MIRLQQKYGVTPGGQAQTATFDSANVATNGLIVAGYFACTQPGASPVLTISDSKGNTYVSIGTVKASEGGEWTALLHLWYVASCAAGANTVSLAQTASGLTSRTIALGIFEYTGGFTAIDASQFVSSIEQASITASVTATQPDLVFAFATCLAANPFLTLAAGAFALDQVGSLGIVGGTSIGRAAAAAEWASSGAQAVTFNTRLLDPSIQLLGMVALAAPAASSPPTPPPQPPLVPSAPTGIQGSTPWQDGLAAVQKQPLYVLWIPKRGVFITSFVPSRVGVLMDAGPAELQGT